MTTRRRTLELTARVRKVGYMSKDEAINSLCWIIINSASQGYVSSNDLDFANSCLDKLQGNLAPRGEQISGLTVDGETLPPIRQRKP